MFSSITSLSSILASSPPSEITINSSAVKSLSGVGTYDISENGQCIGIVNNANHYYLSINGGLTFTYKGALPSSIVSFHMSDNGQYIIAQNALFTTPTTIYYSTDTGVNWNTKEILQGSVFSTGISADGKYAIISGDNPGWNQNGKSNVFVSNDNMVSFTNIFSATYTGNQGNGISMQAVGGFIDRQNGQNIMIASNNGSTPANLQYYLSTNYGSSFTFKTVGAFANAPYGRRAYVNGTCFILTTTSSNNIYVSINSGLLFTKANSTIVSQINHQYNLHYSDNQIVSNADGSKIYYVYNNHIYVSTDQLQNSSVYVLNLSNEKDSNNNFVGIIKASSTGKYMLTWNDGLIKTTDTSI